MSFLLFATYVSALPAVFVAPKHVYIGDYFTVMVDAKYCHAEPVYLLYLYWKLESDSQKYGKICQITQMTPATSDCYATCNTLSAQEGVHQLYLWQDGSQPNPLTAEFKVDVDVKTRKMVVQTAKALYKKGELVEYRVVAFDSFFKPLNGGSVNVEIKSTKMKLSKFVTTLDSYGTLKDDFQLSDQAMTGVYTIRVCTAAGKGCSETEFTVDEYVLPKYEAKISVDQDVYFGELKSLTGSFDVVYTSGNSVPLDTDSVQITAKPLLGLWYPDWMGSQMGSPPEVEQHKATVNYNDKTFTINSIGMGNYYQNWVVTIQAKDPANAALSAGWENQHSYVESEVPFVLKSNHEFELEVTTDDVFKPGHSQKVQITAVGNLDKIPETLTMEFQLSYGYVPDASPSSSRPGSHKRTFSLDTTGKGEFSFSVPLDKDFSWDQVACDPTNKKTFHHCLTQMNLRVINQDDSYSFTTKPYSVCVSREQSFNGVWLGLDNNVLTSTTPLKDQNISRTLIGSNVILSIAVPVITESVEISVQDSILGDEKSSTVYTTQLPAIELSELDFDDKFEKLAVYYEVVSLEKDGMVSSVSLKHTKEIQFGSAPKVQFAAPTDGASETYEVDQDGTKVSKPGSNVTLNATCDTGGKLYLQGEDVSVVLQSKSAAITQETIAAILGHVDIDTVSDEINSPTNCHRSKGYESILREAGVQMPVGTSDGESCDEQLQSYQCHGEPEIRGGDFPMPAAAAPVAESAPAAPNTAAGGPVRVRKNFAESWLFKEMECGSSNQEQTPDTITTYNVNAIVMHPVTGLAIAKSDSVAIRKTVYASLLLPYSLKLKEVAKCSFTVITSLTDTDFDCSVEMVGEGVVLTDVPASVTVTNGAFATTIQVSSERITRDGVENTITATIRCTLPGGKQYTDALQRQVRVKPTGKKQSATKNLLFKQKASSTVRSMIPNNSVNGSAHYTIAIRGDPMGQTLENLDRLVRQPTGCGEQNMLTLVPMIALSAYLIATNRMDAKLSTKLTQYIMVGYQREFNYQHEDTHGFSAFGEGTASTWLTAFVAQSFCEADNYITIDHNEIQKILGFLVSVCSSGECTEGGSVIHTEMVGESSKKALTTFVSLGMSQCHKLLEENKSSLDDPDGLNGIKSTIENMSQNIQSDSFYNSLEPIGKLIANVALRHSEYLTADQACARSKALLPAGSDHFTITELNGYLLQACVGDVDVMGVVDELLSARTEYGGYGNSQDTIVALKGLAVFSENLPSPNAKVTYTVTDRSSGRQLAEEKTLDVTKDTVEVVHGIIQDDATSDFRVLFSAEPLAGQSFGLFVASVFQYWNDDSAEEGESCFEIVRVDNGCDVHIKMIPEQCGSTHDQMAMIEAELPSGCEPVQLEALKMEKKFDRIELIADQVNVYLKNTAEKTSFKIEGTRAVTIADAQPSLSKVYHYYKSSTMRSTLAIMCDDCSEAEIDEQLNGDKNGSGNNNGFGGIGFTIVCFALAFVL